MMMRLILTLSLLTALGARAQTVYQAATIPKPLLPYASAVVRNMEVSTQVVDLTHTVEHTKKVVTVLNKNGDGQAHIVVWYNKSNRIKYIKGIIYDEFGKPVSKFNDKNFSDYSVGGDASMFVDSRVKSFTPAVITYPYTIEYEYEVLSKQSLNFSDWSPNETNGTAVEHSIYQFTCKPDFNILYKELNYPGKVAASTNQGFKTYTWELKDLKALRSEPYSPDPELYQTVVKVAPEKFSFEGYEGSFTNWNELGKWVHDKLLVGRTSLSPTTVADMRSLTDTIKDPKMKARAIYEYMQRKTRYVSVQIGIGGFQPFTANEVDQVSYGDCKALVNYTQALLKAVNIDSYYCVVQAGGELKKSLMPDFASMAQGNHIILCLPFKSDTTWLECTSKDIPFGFLGDFTDDRLVLACTAEGGKILHTPKYTSAQSRQIRKAMLTLKDDGELTGSMNTTFEGWQYENRPNTPGDNEDEIKKAKERYGINNMEIETFALRPVKSLQPVNNEAIKFTARDYASVAAGTYFFHINLANRNTYVPREIQTRNTDVYINRGYTDVDEITYQVPAGYRLDSNPLLVNINKPFGKFTATAFMNDKNQVVYKRKLEIIDGLYAKSSYQDLVDFYQHVADADNYKVALVKAN
jgi:transglutaminase-like putative cysteine protease